MSTVVSWSTSNVNPIGPRKAQHYRFTNPLGLCNKILQTRIYGEKPATEEGVLNQFF